MRKGDLSATKGGPSMRKRGRSATQRCLFVTKGGPSVTKRDLFATKGGLFATKRGLSARKGGLSARKGGLSVAKFNQWGAVLSQNHQKTVFFTLGHGIEGGPELFSRFSLGWTIGSIGGCGHRGAT